MSAERKASLLVALEFDHCLTLLTRLISSLLAPHFPSLFRQSTCSGAEAIYLRALFARASQPRCVRREHKGQERGHES